jgi:hypothetical protein
VIAIVSPKQAKASTFIIVLPLPECHDQRDTNARSMPPSKPQPQSVGPDQVSEKPPLRQGELRPTNGMLNSEKPCSSPCGTPELATTRPRSIEQNRRIRSSALSLHRATAAWPRHESFVGTRTAIETNVRLGKYVVM